MVVGVLILGAVVWMHVHVARNGSLDAAIACITENPRTFSPLGTIEGVSKRWFGGLKVGNKWTRIPLKISTDEGMWVAVANLYARRDGSWQPRTIFVDRSSFYLTPAYTFRCPALASAR